MTKRQILDYLDQCNFPMLDNGYYYHADQELTIYRKDEKWAMVLQVIQYNNHSRDISGFSTIAYKYGSGYHPEESFTDESFFFFAEDVDAPTFIKDEGTFNSFLNPLSNYIKVNKALIPIEHDRSKYFENKIELESKEKIRPWEVLRYVTPKYSNHFWANRSQLGIDPNLIEEIKFRKWEHPNNIDTTFSYMDSFKHIAKCISNNTRFDAKIVESEQSNTHWSHWHHGGKL